MIRNEFATAWSMEFPLLESLQLTFKHYEYFVYSQCIPAWLLLALRATMCTVCTAVILYVAIVTPTLGAAWPLLPPAVENASSSSSSAASTDSTASSDKQHLFLCYLTVWSYLLIVLYFTTALANTLAFRLWQRHLPEFRLTAGGFKTWAAVEDGVAVSSRLMRCSLRLQWLLLGVAANMSLLVTIGYYSLVRPFKRAPARGPKPISWVNLMLHAFNLVFLLLEVACSGVPVRLGHLVFTLAFAALYALFSLLYWLMNYRNVMYKVLLDWNNPGLTLLMMSAILIIAMPVIQLIWWLIFVARGLVGSAIDARQVGETADLLDTGGT